MSIHHRIKALREKPRHVRERMLVVALAVLAPVLLACGVWAFLYERAHTAHEETVNFKTLGAYFSGTVQDAQTGTAAFTAALSGTASAPAAQ